MKASEAVSVSFVARDGQASTLCLKDCLRSCPQISGIAGCLVWIQLENDMSWSCLENHNSCTAGPVDPGDSALVQEVHCSMHFLEH